MNWSKFPIGDTSEISIDSREEPNEKFIRIRGEKLSYGNDFNRNMVTFFRNTVFVLCNNRVGCIFTVYNA